jgi:hypothetical protein
MAAAAGDDRLHVDLHLGHRVGEQNRIGGIGGHEDDIRLGALELDHHRGQIAGGAGIGLIKDHLVAGRLGHRAPILGEAVPPVAVLVDESDIFYRDAEFLLHVLEKLELVAGPPGILGGDAEDVLEAAFSDGVPHRHRYDEWHTVALGDLSGGIGHRRVPAAGQQVDLLAVDHPLGFGHAGGRVALAVREQQFQFRPAEGLDAAGGIDLLDRHLPRLLPLDADRRRRPGERDDVANLHRLGRFAEAGATERQG